MTDRAPASDFGFAFPACEYCGHDVYPGEEQDVGDDKLFWHKNRCFRCYGCHREFFKDRRCNLLPCIALCDDCFPRREFLLDDWRNLNNLSTKQRRVIFLSPVVKPKNTRKPPSESPVKRVRTPGSGLRTSGSVDPTIRASESSSSAKTSDTARKSMNTELQKTGGPPQPERPSISELAAGSGTGAPEESPVIAVEKSHDDVAPQSSEKGIEEQIAEAMGITLPTADIGPPREPVQSPFEAPEHAASRVEKTNRVEKIVVDKEFLVFGLNEWEEVVPNNMTESEYLKLNEGYNEDQNPRSVSALALRVKDERFPNNGDLRRPEVLRRSSSCPKLDPGPDVPETHNLSADKSNDSMHSVSLVEFRTSSDEKEEIDQARQADTCASPLSIPQSSTPILRSSQAYICDDRPPSSFCDEKLWRQSCRSSSRTISPQDTSLEREDGAKERSFQELRALFLTNEMREKPRIPAASVETQSGHQNASRA
ncbi:uncharacterized protein LOC100908894 [Galendromus occidentalis]|uniref:Uncharacterized protein LOC100908894 n=1 Tax=Galendromus occidentalis TaxID=34638 RepID=A0AAJ7L6W1_9ACAR|nr:uncharacterized protein LOC100908894 [Galendromus occidentalis]